MTETPHEQRTGGGSAGAGLLSGRLSQSAQEAMKWLVTSDVASTRTVKRAIKTIRDVWGAEVIAEIKAFAACSHTATSAGSATATTEELKA